jgi:hypothetical protein
MSWISLKIIQIQKTSQVIEKKNTQVKPSGSVPKKTREFLPFFPLLTETILPSPKFSLSYQQRNY